MMPRQGVSALKDLAARLEADGTRLMMPNTELTQTITHDAEGGAS